MESSSGNGENAQYLTWNQVPETVKFEVETLLSQIYGLTNTPRISFDSLKGTGNAVSGVAFDYVFMSTHLNVENLNETVGEFMQRRVNFLVSALGTINTSLNGEIWSQEHAITFVGNVDNVLEEIEQIKEEQAEKQQNEISRQEQLAKFSRQGNQSVK